VTISTPATTGEPEAVVLEGKVRDRDRDTSWEAAAAQTNGKTAELQKRLYDLLLMDGPMTDDELRARLRFLKVPHTRSGVSTRRCELWLAGWVVPTAKRRQSDAGKGATVWRAVRDDEPAPEPPAASIIVRKSSASATVRDARAILADGGPDTLERLRARLSA
jgi:hypothetical protein